MLNDTDLIFASLACNKMFELYEGMTLAQKTDLKEFGKYLDSCYGATETRKRYLFENIQQQENENAVSFLERVKRQYYYCRDCEVPADDKMAEIEKHDIAFRFKRGLRTPKTRQLVTVNNTKYELLGQQAAEYDSMMKEFDDSMLGQRKINKRN